METHSWNPHDLMEPSDPPSASSQVPQNIETPNSPGSVTSQSPKKRRGRRKLKILELKEKLKEAKAKIKTKNTQLSHCVQFIEIVHRQFADIISGLKVFVTCAECDQNFTQEIAQIMQALSSQLLGNFERFGDTISMLQSLNGMLKGAKATSGPNIVNNEQPSTSKNAVAQLSPQLPEMNPETVQNCLSNIETFLSLHEDRHSDLNVSQEPQSPVVNHPTELLELSMETVSRNGLPTSQMLTQRGKLIQQTRQRNTQNSRTKGGTGDRHEIDSVNQNACICGNVYSGKKGVVNHIQSQQNKKAFACHLCQVKVSSHTAFRNHLQNKHQVEYLPSQLFDCYICGGKFSSWEAVLKHHQNVHQDSYNRLEDMIGLDSPPTAVANDNAESPVMNFITDNSTNVPEQTFYSQPTPQPFISGLFDNQGQNLIRLNHATETNVDWSPIVLKN